MKPFRLALLATFLCLSTGLSLVVSRADTSDPKPLYVEGYTGETSYAPGDTVSLHVSTTARTFNVEIARLGPKREVVLSTNGIPGQEFPVPENASSQGCGWGDLFHFNIPAEWASGYYEITLRVDDYGGAYVQKNRRIAEGTCFFILRSAHPGTNSRILIQLSSNTYNAYNNWGGFSVYGYHGRNRVQGHRVSFRRPPHSQFGTWEYPFIAWAESHGYKLDYAANYDLERRRELLSHYRLVLSVGHDEYWSAKMRDSLEDFIGKGGNVAFFSGNTCCWQIRTEDDGAAFVCWKQSYNQDPAFSTVYQPFLSTLWSHHLVGRPENQLTGVGFLSGGYHLSHGQFMDGKGSYTVHRPEHWIFEGTGLKQNDEFGAKNTIVGYECDGCEYTLENGLPVPTCRDGTPRTFTILGTCPAKWHPDDAYWYDRFEKNRVGASVLGVYTRGGTVFTCGSTDWSHGLRGKDPFVEQITSNILNRLSQP